MTITAGKRHEWIDSPHGPIRKPLDAKYLGIKKVTVRPIRSTEAIVQTQIKRTWFENLIRFIKNIFTT